MIHRLPILFTHTTSINHNDLSLSYTNILAFSLGVLHPGMPLNWAIDGDEGEDPSLAILNAIEEEFHRKTMIARQKTKGMRKLLNLKSSINYDDASAPSRHWKGKAHMM
jgi:hypothetical protein